MLKRVKNELKNNINKKQITKGLKGIFLKNCKRTSFRKKIKKSLHLGKLSEK